MNQFSTHMISSSLSGDAEVSGLSGCDALSLGESFFDILKECGDFFFKCQSVLD